MILSNQSAITNSTNFVKKNGSQFLLNGQRFKFIGVNNYPLVQNNYSISQLQSFFNYAKADGVSVVRCWAFNKNSPATSGVGDFLYGSSGAIVYNEPTFVALDNVLNQASLAGIKVILVLQDNYQNKKEDYCKWNDIINGTTYRSSPGFTITSLTQTGGIATAVTNTAHGYRTGNLVTIVSAFNAGYNLTNAFITVVDSVTFTYAVAAGTPSPDAGGTPSVSRPTLNTAFFDDANVRGFYQGFAKKLITRVNTVNGLTYSNDPTIFSWELGNELTYSQANDPNINTLTSFNLSQLGGPGGWADEMSTYIKSLDTNHMVAFGDAGHTWNYVSGDQIYNGSYYGVDFTITGSLPNIDYFDFHVYPYGNSPAFTMNTYGVNLGYPSSAPTVAGLSSQLQNFIALAKQNNKPIIIGEWGLDKRNSNNAQYPAYPRATHYEKVFDDFLDNDADGFVFWHYTNLFDDNNYNIQPSGPHTGSNDPFNQNADDTALRQVMLQQSENLPNF